MQVFAVFDVSDPERLKRRLQGRYPSNDYYICEPSTFFIASRGKTTQQVWNEIGSDDAGPIRGIATSVTSFWGFHDRELWEWISVKLSTNGD